MEANMDADPRDSFWKTLWRLIFSCLAIFTVTFVLLHFVGLSAIQTTIALTTIVISWSATIRLVRLSRRRRRMAKQREQKPDRQGTFKSEPSA